MPDREIGINMPMQSLEYLLRLDPSSNQRFIQVQEIAERCDVSTSLLEQHLDWLYKAEDDKMVEDRINKIYCISPMENRMRYRMLAAGIIFIQQFRYKLGRADFRIHPNRILEVDGDSTHGNYMNGYTFYGKSVESVKLKDRQQTEYLQNQGFSVIRFWSHEVYSDIKACINKIIQFVTSFTFVSFSQSFFAGIKIRDKGDI
jgi:very-short-patch-repair endonuclease